MRCRLVTLAVLALGLASPSIQAEYPEKPVRLIVPAAPGGGTNIVGRLLADQLTVLLKQQFVVDNKPGAGNMIGADFVAKSPPDGYTLLVGTSAELTIAPSMYAAMRYDPVKDFVPVSMLGASVNVILANPNFEPRTLQEVVAYAKANPGKLFFAHGGTGTSPHLSGELLKSMGKFPMTPVAYKGGGPALVDVASGQTQLMISTLGPALPLIKAQKVRAIAVTSANRSALLPDVPTVAEQGFPGYETVTWYALMAPAGTPDDVIVRLRHAISFILKTPEVLEKFAGLGIEPDTTGTDTARISERINSESVRWGRLVKELGIRAE